MIFLFQIKWCQRYIPKNGYINSKRSSKAILLVWSIDYHSISESSISNCFYYGHKKHKENMDIKTTLLGPRQTQTTGKISNMGGRKFQERFSNKAFRNLELETFFYDFLRRRRCLWSYQVRGPRASWIQIHEHGRRTIIINALRKASRRTA